MDELCCELHLFYSINTEFMVKVIINIKFYAGRRWSVSERHEVSVLCGAFGTHNKISNCDLILLYKLISWTSFSSDGETPCIISFGIPIIF